jgi:DNA-binding CsgD family transcriptional regulator
LLYDTQQLRRIQTWERTVGARLFTLTHREWDVLRLVASGHSNREIAQLLSLSEHTVEKHLTALLGNLGVSSRTGLLAFILRYRLDHSEGLASMADFRHTGMAEIRHREIADFRDVKVPSP